jgi:hypothetical protein
VYAVIACPRCRRARVVEQRRKQAECPSCGRTLQLANLRSFHAGPSLDEARHAAGVVNARLSGREREFTAALVMPTMRPARHDDEAARAAAMARKASSEKDRADLVARALGAFSEDDLTVAFARAGLPVVKVEAHLRRMLATGVVFEPSSGLYKAL